MKQQHWFMDDAHKDTFAELKEKAKCGNDREYNSALYILAALDKNINSYVSPEGIEFPELINDASPWSSGEKALINLAANLFNGYVSADVRDTFWNLDYHNTLVAIAAISIRFGR